MARLRKPDIEGWRDSVSPESPTPSLAPTIRDEKAGDSLTVPTTPIRQRGSVMSFITHPRVYPVLVKIRNVFWLHAIVHIAGLLFVLPTTSLEKHMMMLESSNVILRNMWWMYASSGFTQSEYHRRARRREFDEWVEGEKEVAWDRLLRNIGAIAGAGDGTIIASPSDGDVPNEPDYYYIWTRDSALTMSTIIAAFLPNQSVSALPHAWQGMNIPTNDSDSDHPIYEPVIRSYMLSQAEIQQRSNPSGDLWTGGLNEPKFNIDGSRFDGDWGRPQRDGPALRALALIPYAHYLLDRGWPADLETVKRHLYNPTAIRAIGSVIKNDLEEVGGSWWFNSFDLWEEIDGHHLFTLLACLRALQEGAKLAKRMHDPKAAEYYFDQADKLIDILPAFWDEEDRYWRSTSNVESGIDRQWLDCALPLSVVHFGSSDGMFGATSHETLASLRAYVTSFRGLYPVNEPAQPPPAPSRLRSWFSNKSLMRGQADWTSGWAVGRYAEDVYNGVGISRGNPWYICTFAVAHVLYLAKEGFEQQGHIPLDNLTRPFWSDLLGSKFEDDEQGFWSREKDKTRKPLDTKMFRLAITQLGEVGDKYLSIGRTFAPEGRMSEQMDRHDGSPVGARDLTWSYASFIDATRARDRAGGGDSQVDN